MKNEEVIRLLNLHCEYLKNCWKPHPDYNVLEALEIAICEMEKKIPKKVEIPPCNKCDDSCKNCRYGITGFKKYVCPTCHSRNICCLEYDFLADNCPDCGQKLDWSDFD